MSKLGIVEYVEFSAKVKGIYANYPSKAKQARYDEIEAWTQ